MLKSMTGYGGATQKHADFVLAVEVRCVNNKFLKVTSKTSEEVSFLQNEIEAPVRSVLARGSVYVTVQFEPATNANFYEIDETLLEKYLMTVKKLEGQLDCGGKVALSDLLLLPGVVHQESVSNLSTEEVRPVALATLKTALDAVVGMRIREGEELAKEFRHRGQNIRDLVRSILETYPTALQEYHVRLRERVRNLLADTDVKLSDEDLLKEIALLAERSDISEELSRMDSHLGQFEDSLDAADPVGKKLEFIVQEMFRECNTMGSKSISSELNRLVVDIKAEVTRLKEQVLNVE
jgi:uncharacterized protein (TIGR00255 family)